MRRDQEIVWRLWQVVWIDAAAISKSNLPPGSAKSLKTQPIEIEAIVIRCSQRNVEQRSLIQAIQRKIAAIIALRRQSRPDEHIFVIKRLARWLEAARKKHDIQQLYV